MPEHDAAGVRQGRACRGLGGTRPECDRAGRAAAGA